MITIKDIADDCQVSPATVSLALNGDARVADATRRKVEASSRRLGYRPNAAAQMLRSGNTNNIVVAYVKESEYVGIGIDIVYTLAERLGALGYKLEMRHAPTNEELLQQLKDLVRSRAADAFVLWGLEHDVEDQAKLLDSLGQPFVARGYYDHHPEWPQVDVDHVGMMRQTIAKLVDLGHERIALLSHANNFTYAVKFRQAFHDVVAERFHRSTPDEWILLSHETAESADHISFQVQNWFTKPRDQRPTAIACGEAGSVVPSVEMALLSQGVRVGDEPGRFAVIGITSFPHTKFVTGPSWAYHLRFIAAMTNQAIDEILVPLLGHEAPTRNVVRYLPTLERHWPIPDIWSSGAIQVNPEWEAKVL